MILLLIWSRRFVRQLDCGLSLSVKPQIEAVTLIKPAADKKQQVARSNLWLRNEDPYRATTIRPDSEWLYTRLSGKPRLARSQSPSINNLPDELLSSGLSGHQSLFFYQKSSNLKLKDIVLERFSLLVSTGMFCLLGKQR